ncbi:MAG TPA: hypothetical protein PL033_00380 [Candidatus Brocadiia bacterium]|nr:hypothetical protein [Candidatus Brocadiia bacterium]
MSKDETRHLLVITDIAAWYACKEKGRRAYVVRFEGGLTCLVPEDKFEEFKKEHSGRRDRFEILLTPDSTEHDAAKIRSSVDVPQEKANKVYLDALDQMLDS